MLGTLGKEGYGPNKPAMAMDQYTNAPTIKSLNYFLDKESAARINKYQEDAVFQQAANLGLQEANDEVKQMHLRLSSSFMDQGKQLLGVKGRLKKMIVKIQALPPSISDTLLLD